MIFKIAWRNMWRSRRRTLITISSIFFAVLIAIIYRALMVGILDKTISDNVSISTGYLQIHHTGYWENKSVDSSFAENSNLSTVLNNEKEITVWTPRLESFALASSGGNTKGMLVIGINPAKEDSVSHLSQDLIAGKYLADSDKSIMLAEGLASYLKLKLNDTVVLLGQGFEGNMAVGKYTIKGIVHLPVPEMNKQMAWLPMACSQGFLSTGARYTSIAIMVNDGSKLAALKQDIIKQTKGFGYEIMTWQKMIPELNQFYNMEMAIDYGVMAGILYLVIAFGIFGTMLMMLHERLHEFGILIAIGMKKVILSRVVMIEMVLISITGTVLAMVAAFPLLLYFRLHPIRMSGAWASVSKQFNFSPIIQPSMKISNFIIQGYIVLSIAVVLSLYAIYKVHKIKIITAINS